MTGKFNFTEFFLEVLDDCSKLDDPMDVMTCITAGLDNLGSDCYDCICDVLPYLCWMLRDR